MALVAYEYSDSESDTELNEKKTKINKNEQSLVSELFSFLPKPKQQISIKEELDDVLLKKNETKVDETKKPVKIAIPALSSYKSDDEEPPKKIIRAPIERASGLFAILPTPKCTPYENKNPKFDAKVVKQKNLIPRTVKANAVAKKHHDSDDEEISSSNFFSFTEPTKFNVTQSTLTSTLSMQVDSAKPVKDVSGKSNAFFSDLVARAAKTDAEEKTVEEVDGLEENAVEELCGKRSKKLKNNEINFIDVNAADVMPDPREWRVKALTEEAPNAAVKKGEEPSLQSRKKHQITYLAYQAKMNEQELKNQWALNRMSRKQTQAKYGF